MGNNFKPKLASLITMSYYNHLIDLSLMNMEESDEYYKTIDKLKKVIEIEHNEYQNLSKEEILSYFNASISINSLIDARIYLKIKEMYHKLNNTIIIDNKYLLSDIIATKFII